MISWLSLGNDQWIFSFSDRTIPCDSSRELVICSHEAGIDFKEMKIAEEEMEKMNHNFCSFGIRKKFVCSSRV